MPSASKRRLNEADTQKSPSPAGDQSIKSYRIVSFDGSVLELEGELAVREGVRVLLDGHGQPWLQFTEQDLVTEIDPPSPSKPGARG